MTRWSALIRISRALSMDWLFQWMKNNYTDIKKVNSNMKSRVTNSWIGLSLVSCSIRQMTWPDSWKSNTGTGDCLQVSCPNHVSRLLLKICSRMIRKCTYSEVSITEVCLDRFRLDHVVLHILTIWLVKIWLCKVSSHSFSVKLKQCNNFQFNSKLTKRNCRSFWPNCCKNCHRWLLSILNCITF